MPTFFTNLLGGNSSPETINVDPIAAQEVIDEAVLMDDEATASAEYDALMRRFIDGEFDDPETGNADWAKFRAVGNLYKAKWGHTAFVQAERCCSCACPWDE